MNLLHMPQSPETLWVIIGFVGQSLFFMRFFIQWLASEKAGRSVIPNAFWYFSMMGGVILFLYALWRQDPVFILGQSTGLFIMPVISTSFAASQNPHRKISHEKTLPACRLDSGGDGRVVRCRGAVPPAVAHR